MQQVQLELAKQASLLPYTHHPGLPVIRTVLLLHPITSLLLVQLDPVRLEEPHLLLLYRQIEDAVPHRLLIDAPEQAAIVALVSLLDHGLKALTLHGVASIDLFQ